MSKKRTRDDTDTVADDPQYDFEPSARKSKVRKQSLYTPDGVIVHNNWYSASSVHNYMLNDPIVDWFKLIDTCDSNSRTCSQGMTATTATTELPHTEQTNTGDSLSSYLMKRGVEFEAAIMRHIANIVGDVNIVKVCTEYQKVYTRAAVLETIELMKRGVPIIYQGVLHNTSDATFGSPDLLVRSDYINMLVKSRTMSKHEETIAAPKLRKRFHYRVIDIKFCTLKLRADGQQLLNAGRAQCNKAQVMIYNQALGQSQGYVPPVCYILGRGYVFKRKGNVYKSNNVCDRLGEIRPTDTDFEYKERIRCALAWLKELRANGRSWSALPTPSVPQLYPNMSNTNDAPWHQRKLEIAEKLNEITLVWQCGPKHRNRCLENGIRSYLDTDCTAEALGINGPINGTILQRMLEFNQGKIHQNELVIPKKIYNNWSRWREINRFPHLASDPTRETEFFIDYENVTNIADDFSTIPASSTQNIVFMIGVGYFDTTDQYIYKCFVAAHLNIQSEFTIFDNFDKYIKAVCDTENTNPNFYHWGNVEETLYDSVVERHEPKSFAWSKPNFVDFCKIFKNEVILVKGALNFGLKTIIKQLHKHNLITTHYHTDVLDGGDALVKAIDAYNVAEENCIDIKDTASMQSVIKYNRIDTLAIADIVRYLRANHSASSDSRLASIIQSATSWFPEWIQNLLP